jgi:PAS domain-containing protein
MALTERGVICYANAAFAKLVGRRNPGDVQGKSLADFRPRGYPCSATESPNGQGAAKHHLCQFVVQKPSGSTLKIESSCASFCAHGREFQLLTVRDVSVRERRRMIRDQDRSFRTIFEAASMGIVQCDLQGQVLECNPAIEKTLGYTRVELHGMHFREFTQPEEQIARSGASQAIWSELKESVTAMLLSCDLALASKDVSPYAADRIRMIHDLATQMRARFISSEQN